MMRIVNPDLPASLFEFSLKSGARSCAPHIKHAMYLKKQIYIYTIIISLFIADLRFLAVSRVQDCN